MKESDPYGYGFNAHDPNCEFCNAYNLNCEFCNEKAMFQRSLRWWVTPGIVLVAVSLLVGNPIPGLVGMGLIIFGTV